MWQFVIEDESDLSGESLSALLASILEAVGPMSVRVGDVEGAGNGMSRLRMADSHGQVLSGDEVVDLASRVVQIDWGDFFFFDCQSAAETLSHDEEYAVSVPRARVVLRAVDDTYYYVYGREEKLLTLLREKYPTAEITRGEVAEFSFPY